MKNARLFSLVMAVVMLVSAVAASPAAAMRSTPQSQSNTGIISSSAPTYNASAFSPLSMTNFYYPDYNVGASAPYSCYLVNQSPKDWVTMKPRQYFDIMWTVLNTGHKWDGNYTVIKYLWGAKMQTRGDFFDLDNVGYGKKAHIGIDMIAPKTPGTYPITWGIFSGGYRVCTLTFIVTVVK